jgi:hypothetical protein
VDKKIAGWKDFVAGKKARLIREWTCRGHARTTRKSSPEIPRRSRASEVDLSESWRWPPRAFLRGLRRRSREESRRAFEDSSEVLVDASTRLREVLFFACVLRARIIEESRGQTTPLSSGFFGNLKNRRENIPGIEAVHGGFRSGLQELVHAPAPRGFQARNLPGSSLPG